MKYTRFFTLFLTLCLFLAGEAPFAHALTAPSVKAEAIVLADMDSGNILYEKNMHKWIRAFNGVSKLIVLLPPKAFPGKLGVVDFFIKDEVIHDEIQPILRRLAEDLYCAMVKSANEACNVIATAVAGNIQNFINRMNTRAAELGAKNTYFSDTNGLSSEHHYTTAHDLFLISRIEPPSMFLFLLCISLIVF